MGTAASLLANWTSSNSERVLLNKNEPELVLRWLNEAQLRFVDRSEVLKSVWTPIVDSDGTAVLPDDFLHEVINRVKWDTNTFLTKGDYPDLILDNFSVASYYAIWGDKFYVFAPASGEPEIPYIRKPDTILLSTINNADLEIPTEFQTDLLLFLDAMWERYVGNSRAGFLMLKEFEAYATQCGMRDAMRKNAVPMMKGRVL